MEKYTIEEEQFYPTPESFLEKICCGIKWGKINSVLEPSAGKGDIVDYVKKSMNTPYSRYDILIDCIEKDSNLRKMLEGKDYHVIHDDFLTYQGRYHYDMIIMNPPFKDGDKHLLKAFEVQKYGGSILCILNAETLKNPYSVSRKLLVQKLEEYNADIQYYTDAFLADDVERKTNVEVAVVKVEIPQKQWESDIFQRLKEKKYKDIALDQENMDLAVPDLIKSIVKQYELEVEAGICLIREYKGMQKHILNSLKDNEYNNPIIQMKVGDSECSENKFIYRVRTKYWNALFRNAKFTGNMTSEQQEKYLSQVDKLVHYDFSYSNIKELQTEMALNMVKGIEECIIKLFDDCSAKHSYYPECEKNVHYYNGWCRNKAWIVNEKIILPINIFAPDIHNKLKVSTYSFNTHNLNLLYDIEKVFNYLGGKPSNPFDCSDVLFNMKRTGEYQNIRFKYFTAKFYKKGTCHITFLDKETLKKFNIFGSQRKGWLPPSYGKKSYMKMEPEEQEVIDEFQGIFDYENVFAHAEQYIYNPLNSLPQIETVDQSIVNNPA